jgi:hypothetical protein
MVISPIYWFLGKYLPAPAKVHTNRALQRLFAREFAGASHIIEKTRRSLRKKL